MPEINRHHIHVEVQGPEDGPAVILLHEGLGSVRSWKAQIPFLAQAGWRVLAYDRWGYGASDGRDHLSMPTFEDDLADLKVLFSHYGLSRAALVGHSDGGTIALYFAARHPQVVSCVVTIAAHIYWEPKMIPGIESIRGAYEHNSRLRESLRRAHGDKFESVFYGWFNGWYRPENLAWDMSAELRKITCPAWVVQGMEDEHATPQHARDIAASIPNAELWLSPDAGHMLPQENADEFNARLLAFLTRNAVIQNDE